MAKNELIKKFFKGLYEIDDCVRHVEDGRLDKAILLFILLYRSRSSGINFNSHEVNYDLIHDAVRIYNYELSDSVYGAVDIINDTVTTNFTKSLKGNRVDKNKYYVNMKVYEGGFVQIKKLMAKVNKRGQWVLTFGSGNSSSFADILVFDTEQEAQTFLDNSKLTETPAFKDRVFEITEIQTYYNTPICINNNPVEYLAVNMPIYYLQKVVGNANIWLYSPMLSFHNPVLEPTSNAIIEQYDL